jgi:hypothetical protein
MRTGREAAAVMSACGGSAESSGVPSVLSATALMGALLAGADENDSRDTNDDVSPMLDSVLPVAATATRPLNTFTTASAPTEVSTAALAGQNATRRQASSNLVE